MTAHSHLRLATDLPHAQKAAGRKRTNINQNNDIYVSYIYFISYILVCFWN